MTCPAHRGRHRHAGALRTEAEAATVTARSFRLRYAIRHPIRTLRRSHAKAIDHTGFGLGQCAGIAAFTVAVLLWLTNKYLSHYP